jgi:phosphoglycerate dehydrogenase-like enzyme
MKKTAVFMNIGRGLTVKETDLVQALKEKMIAGAVLDVFEKEPLTENSEIWECENVLITPHCADQDSDHCLRAVAIFGENLERYVKDGTKNLVNVIDKKLGY